MARSRSEAADLIARGEVVLGGVPALKAATLVDGGASIVLARGESRFVSRGGDKLDGALAKLTVDVDGRRWLDAGASTGGFTDRLLQGGARAVIAADVGYGQLAWRLRTDDRVVVLERTNVRHLSPDQLPWPPEGIVADLSFISLTAVLPALKSVASDDADYVLLVKPQFEAGVDAVGSGGVVRDPIEWRRALGRVVEAGRSLGLGLVDACASPLTGPAGNREFFVHLRRGPADAGVALDRAIAEAPA
jgi:23S rRNA (cytidine1920-2'-O)/16S rRNA (cytidine1409-2'-O)-methyltransferase